MKTNIIDVHSHILNFGCCPDKWLAKLTHIPKIESLLKLPFSKNLFKCLTWILRFGKYNKIEEMIEIFSTHLFEVGDILRKEMDEAGVKLTTPLMMDMDYATKDHYPAELDYGTQIEIMKRIASKHYCVIMPFIGFDPRREESDELVMHSLMTKGILGIKMYPKLGFHPSPKSPVNSKEVNGRLNNVYETCQRLQIPITTHCSPGGAYSEKLIGKREERNTLVHPTAWIDVINLYPSLYLNLGHGGGDLYKDEANTWNSYAIDLVNNGENVYFDLAYHGEAHETPEVYFSRLHSQKIPHDKVLFGTDWSMIRHTHTVKEFLQPFLDNLKPNIRARILYKNAIKFLFPENRIPIRITEALNKKPEDTPSWLQNQFYKLNSATYLT